MQICFETSRGGGIVTLLYRRRIFFIEVFCPVVYLIFSCNRWHQATLNPIISVCNLGIRGDCLNNSSDVEAASQKWDSISGQLECLHAGFRYCEFFLLSKKILILTGWVEWLCHQLTVRGAARTSGPQPCANQSFALGLPD